MPLANFDKYYLLAPFDGANNATTANDYSPANQPLIFGGDAKIDTSLGYPALLLDGTGDYVRAAHGYAIGTSDFFVRFLLRLTNAGGTQIIWDKRYRTDINSDHPTLYMLSGQLRYYANGGDRITGGSLTANTDYYIEISRVSGTTRLFLNGTQIGSSYTDSHNFVLPSYDVIGIDRGFATNGVIGRIREFQAALTAGNTSNYTPPAAGGLLKSLSGNVKDDSNTNASRIVRAYPRDWPVRGYQTTSDGSTGNYSITVPDVDGGYIVAALDDAAGTVYKDLVHSQVAPV